MKYYDEFVKSNVNLKRYKPSLEAYEKQFNINFDDIDSQEQFTNYSLWLRDNYSTSASYQRRSAARKYLEFVSEKLNRPMFAVEKVNFSQNTYDDTQYEKVSCQYLFYDQMMEYINKKITDYIDSKVAIDQSSDLLWTGFTYQQVIYTLIWNGYHPNVIPQIKISDIDTENRTINGKKITKGWNYISKLINQKTYYIMRGKGNVVEASYYGNVYLFKHRTTVDESKRYECVTRDELRSIMTSFTKNVLDGEFALPTEIMYNGAISNFFKTDMAHGAPVLIQENLKEFTQNYCVGYNELPSKKMLYDHFEIYKKNLLKYLMEKYNVIDLL